MSISALRTSLNWCVGNVAISVGFVSSCFHVEYRVVFLGATNGALGKAKFLAACLALLVGLHASRADPKSQAQNSPLRGRELEDVLTFLDPVFLVASAAHCLLSWSFSAVILRIPLLVVKDSVMAIRAAERAVSVRGHHAFFPTLGEADETNPFLAAVREPRPDTARQEFGTALECVFPTASDAPRGGYGRCWIRDHDDGFAVMEHGVVVARMADLAADSRPSVD